MKLFLIIVFLVPYFVSAKCYQNGELKYKQYNEDFYYVYQESKKTVSLDKPLWEIRKKWKGIECQKILDKQNRYLVEIRDGICFYDKYSRKMSGKLLFKVINFSGENKLTMETPQGILVMGEGHFLASYYEVPCSKK